MTGPLLVGVDGGASGVRAHVIEVLATGRLRCAGRSVGTDWAGWPGFRPAPLERQLAERDALEAGDLELPEAERGEGQAWVETLANTLAELTFGLTVRGGLQLGVCLPGLRREDGTGTLVARNGPRLPRFHTQLAAALAGRHLALAAPLAPLRSDGEAAGYGEEVAPTGTLSGVSDAYYVACGTGVAEAVKLEGRHVAATELRDVLPAPWSTGEEETLSLARLGALLGGGGTLEERARGAAGDARSALEAWADALGLFLARRVRALDALLGRPLSRVVVGQRSGALLQDPLLLARVAATLDAAEPGFLVASTLREAPALGAAALAREAEVQG